MIYTHTGDCPRCGAPVFAVTKRGIDIPSPNDGPDTPNAHFTCLCHKTLPAPLPDDDELESESVDDADRKHLARTRPGSREGASSERAE